MELKIFSLINSLIFQIKAVGLQYLHCLDPNHIILFSLLCVKTDGTPQDSAGMFAEILLATSMT